MERVAAGPVHQMNIRILVRLATELIGAAGLQQHVADTRHRDGKPTRVGADRHHGSRRIHPRVADPVHRAVTKGETAPRQPHLAEHRRQGNHHPVGLFTAMGALNRIGTGDKTAHTDQLLRQQTDTRRRNAGDGTGPFGRFCHAVVGAAQIIRQLAIAGAVAIEESFVLSATALDFIRQGQHQRHVGIRANWDPFGINKFRAVITHRADVDHRSAFFHQLLQPGFERVLRRTAGRDLGIFQRQAAEGHKQLAVLNHAGPAGDTAGQWGESADHIRQEKLGRSPAVVAQLIDTAAASKIKTAHQRTSVVQAPGR